VILSLLLVITAFSIPLFQRKSLLPSTPIPWKINPFRHNLGWDKLSVALNAFDTEQQFLFGDKYQTTSLLSFYNSKQSQAYFFNLLGVRKNQFSYWPPPEPGKDGIFAVIENTENLEGLIELYKAKLEPYFSKVHPPKKVDLFNAYGVSVKGALLFRCDHFLGNLPMDPEKY